MAYTQDDYKKRMQARSALWDLMQKQKEQETDRNKRNEISKKQAMLHAQNVADGKQIGATYEKSTGSWSTGGNAFNQKDTVRTETRQNILDFARETQRTGFGGLIPFGNTQVKSTQVSQPLPQKAKTEQMRQAQKTAQTLPQKAKTEQARQAQKTAYSLGLSSLAQTKPGETLNFAKSAAQQVLNPTAAQRQQAGDAAHTALSSLYANAGSKWGKEEKGIQQAAVKALEGEMQDTLRQYGMVWGRRSTGPDARFTVSDGEAVQRLRQAGADAETIAKIEENIALREGTNRWAEAGEAIGKRAIASGKAYIETLQQQGDNTDESRKNPRYRQLEAEQKEIQDQMAVIPAIDYYGQETEEYKALVERLREVNEELDRLSVKTPVDQSLWGQTMLREANQAHANATAGLGTVARTAADAGISIAGNAPAVGLSMIPVVGPGLAATYIGTGAAGQKAQALNEQGKSPKEAMERGAVSGIIEAMTEKIPLDTLADVLTKGGKGLVKNVLRQMGVEASEESASYVLNYVADLAARDPEARFSVEELVQNAVGGAISGGVFGGIGTGIGRGRIQTTGENTIQTSGVSEAKRQRIAMQDANFAEQVDGVFNGNLSSDKVISVGDTPDILLTLGAPDIPMTMAQNTALKIAFPPGYYGGSHNLGISALKHLPEQLRDPAAVLRSKTQKDSFVILTEWNDTNGNPVIVAVHLNKKGRIAFFNEIASAYGKNNLKALLGENEENVLYTKNNKSIDQTLDSRLQLPEWISDDTLVAYSIAQETGKINGEIGKNDTEILTKSAEAEAMQRELTALEEKKRQAEAILPGPIREQAIMQAEKEIEAFREKERKATANMLLDAWKKTQAAKEQAEITRKNLHLTQKDIKMAQFAGQNGMDAAKWEKTDNQELAYIYGGALRDVHEASQPVRQYFAERAAEFQNDADAAAEMIATYAKDKRWGLQYQRETMERNIRDIFGKEHQKEAEEIIKEYISPVHKAVAENNRLKNQYRQQVREMKLSKHESALVQMALENETGAAMEYMKNNNIEMTPALQKKINKAAETFRQIYNELYEKINEALILNGMEPAPFRKNYAPHFVKDYIWKRSYPVYGRFSLDKTQYLVVLCCI